MGTVAPARDPADGGHRLQLAERIILSLDVGRGGSRLRSRRRLRPAHLRTGRPRNVAELCRRHAPVAAQWPARAANRYGHEFEIGGAVRVRMHIAPRGEPVVQRWKSCSSPPRRTAEFFGANS